MDAPVNKRIASAKYFTPRIASGLISFAPSKNGLAASINPDMFSPIAGNPEDTPPKKPPTMLPTKSPKA